MGVTAQPGCSEGGQEARKVVAVHYGRGWGWGPLLPLLLLCLLLLRLLLFCLLSHLLLLLHRELLLPAALRRQRQRQRQLLSGLRQARLL
jgi:hypothetical protein